MGSSSSFPYKLDTVLEFKHPFYTLHAGTHNETSNPVSIFALEKSKFSAREDALLAVRNNIKRLKTLRHPTVLKYLDELEIDQWIYIVTEPVTPWSLAYKVNQEVVISHDEIALGLRQMAAALAFVNNDCKLVHCNIQPMSIFVDSSRNWKLGGFELAFELLNEVPAFTRRNSDLLPECYGAPEVVKAEWNSIINNPVWAVDSWSLGCVIYQFYNQNLSRRDQLANLGKIPAALQQDYKKLIGMSAKSRLSAEGFLNSSFFSSQPFVQSILFLEELTLKTPADKDVFFTNLLNTISSLSINCIKLHLLPSLIASMEFGCSGTRPIVENNSTPIQVHPKSLLCLLKMGSMLSASEFAAILPPILSKLFAAPERNLRLSLLQLPEYIAMLPEGIINESIIQNVALGFADATPLLREATLKSMLHFVPKLTEANLNSCVLPHLGKLQTDPEAGIRTNTTICLGKIASHEATRAKLLPSAFIRVLKDAFAPSRSAGILALIATSDFYKPDIIAKTIIPQIVHLTVDPSKEVRESTLRCINSFMSRLVKNSDEMKDSEAIAMQDHGVKSDSVTDKTNGSNSSVLGAVGSMTSNFGSWAISTVSNSVFGGETSKPAVSAPNSTTGRSSRPIETKVSQKEKETPIYDMGNKAETNSNKMDWEDDFFQDFTDSEPVQSVSLSTSKAGSRSTSKTVDREFDKKNDANSILKNTANKKISVVEKNDHGLNSKPASKTVLSQQMDNSFDLLDMSFDSVPKKQTIVTKSSVIQSDSKPKSEINKPKIEVKAKSIVEKKPITTKPLDEWESFLND